KGSVSIKATGGVPAYTYSLDGGAFQSSATFDNLSAGQHKVTVKDNLGCLFEVVFEIKETGSSPHLVVTNPPEICAGITVNLKEASVVAGSDPGLSYTYWKDEGATIPVPDPTAVTAGTYYIKAINDPGCFVIKPVVVTARKPAPGTIAIAGSPFACIGQSIMLTASNGNSYQWYRNDTAISGATAKTYSATASGVYTVDISDGTCTARSAATTRLQFQSCITGPQTGVFVPTAFTPNRNGANDELRPILYNIASLGYFKVYNRWGQMVFQTREMTKGWDGTINGVPQPTETYTWILECTDHDGKTIRKSGRSLLIR
ncbi:MAG TPA: gliding motility-associated C-terminal domain-containing protein, partial [Flavisolibacter sp.]|nr:gliding motility-associated C-terminal domain-containing protein [Flavisolibacter sp.]